MSDVPRSAVTTSGLRLGEDELAWVIGNARAHRSSPASAARPRSEAPPTRCSGPRRCQGLPATDLTHVFSAAIGLAFDGGLSARAAGTSIAATTTVAMPAQASFPQFLIISSSPRPRMECPSTIDFTHASRLEGDARKGSVSGLSGRPHSRGHWARNSEPAEGSRSFARLDMRCRSGFAATRGTRAARSRSNRWPTGPSLSGCDAAGLGYAICQGLGTTEERGLHGSSDHGDCGGFDACRGGSGVQEMLLALTTPAGRGNDILGVVPTSRRRTATLVAAEVAATSSTTAARCC